MTDQCAWQVGTLPAGSQVLCQTPELTMLTIGGSDIQVGRHLHERHDEYGVLVSGRGVLVIGDETVPVETGSAWAIPRGVPHEGRYDGEFRVVVWYTPWEDPDHPDRVNLDPA